MLIERDKYYNFHLDPPAFAPRSFSLLFAALSITPFPLDGAARLRFALFLPTTVTPFPLFTKLLSASSFSFLALAALFFPPRFDT